MSLFGALRTSVSGMNAQSHRIGAVSENIANVSTTGYKRARVEFETICGSDYSASDFTGGVTSKTQSFNNEQGTLQLTGRATDLSLNGSGFFVVTAPDGSPALTRAGAFTPDETGVLVNTAGYRLMGYDLSVNGGQVSNNLTDLTPVLIDQAALHVQPSTAGSLSANLNSDAATGAVSNTSLIAYDKLGHKTQLDFAFAKTGAGAWTATVTGGAGSVSLPMTFDANGALVSSPTLTVTMADGGAVTIDLSKTTQYASAFAVAQATIDGHAPSQLDHIDINQDGVVSAVYQDGAVVPRFKLPIADVMSPDNLTSQNGDVWQASLSSGPIVLGDAQTGGRGSVVSGALEASTVDISTELTTMIEAQRAYTANSKVFQTGSEMLDVLMNLKA